MKRLHRVAVIGVLGMLFGLALGPLGCSDREQGGQAGGEETSAARLVHVYHVRGRVVSLPDASDPASELRIYHEAIDDFKNAEGGATPMKAMTMSFPPAPGVSLEGLAAGDPVEFVFEMQWEPTVAMSTTSIKKLAADTVLSIDSSGGAGDAHTGH